ncbi:MAG: daunorubicin resistance protein DrrA family ABC transporter ATP-binding protein [Fimbriimonadales bacterium]|nr:MAG: daunorubicin resistance protein DrrA family ABC transporter ATP-binding protein [Fimbriimonadales bacterium]
MAAERVVLRAENIESALHGGVCILPMRFEIARGELVALFGPSGSGKSLLLALIAGEVALEGGRLEVADLALMPELPEGRARRTTTPASFLKRYASSFTRAVYLLEVLGLGDQMEAPLTAISDGQRHMLRVGGALAQQAPLYLLDDPFEYADFERRRRLWNELDDRCRFGAAVLFTTRDPAIAARADRVLMLDAGRLIADDTPERLIAEQSTTEIEIEARDPQPILEGLPDIELRIEQLPDGYRLRLNADDALALRLLQEGYGNIRAIYVRPPTLEDAWQWLRLKAHTHKTPSKGD